MRQFVYPAVMVMAMELCVVPACLGADYDIASMDSSSLYPAKVQAVQFGDFSLDSAHFVSVGSWTISWPDGGVPPVATYTSPIVNQSNIVLGPFKCSNAVVGVASCTIVINFAGNYGSHCLFHSSGVGRQTSVIACPTSIDLQ